MLKDSHITLDHVESSVPDKLKKSFQQLYGKSPPKRASRGFLTANIAYRIQEHSHSGVPPKVRKELLSIAQALEKDPDASVVPGQRVKPGTRLVRRWQDEVHQVTVLEDGYEYQGKRHRSLSKIAFEITGTKWSGPAFFGLKKKGRS